MQYNPSARTGRNNKMRIVDRMAKPDMLGATPRLPVRTGFFVVERIRL
jgi:hypothetical protein